jgi:hypothetical protein
MVMNSHHLRQLTTVHERSCAGKDQSRAGWKSVREWGILMNSAKSMPSLAMLRAFDAFGRVGGIRKAALMLDVDHAVISRHLTALESFVGTALIDRSNGVRTLTSDGIEYHRRISAAFQEITNATVMLRKRHDQQLLIWASPALPITGSAPASPRPSTRKAAWALNCARWIMRPISPSTRPMATFAIFATEALWNHLRVPQRQDFQPPVFPVASPNVAETAKLRLRSAGPPEHAVAA